MNNLIRPTRPRSHNRVAAVIAHTTRYAFKGQTRLARDAGISRSALTRLISGRVRSSYTIVHRVTSTLEKALNRKLDCRELVSEDGMYPTQFVCELVGCPGCMPPQFYSPREDIQEAYASVKSGLWTGDNQECADDEWQPIKEVK